MFRKLLRRALPKLPSQCAVCRIWSSDSLCESCVSKFAQPMPRCVTCALPVHPGVQQCANCARTPPPLDQCLAAVAYAYPWSTLMVNFKFHEHTGWAHSFATLLRSAPWVEPALDAADLLVPMPLSAQRLRQRGFNQALLLCRALDADRTAHHVLLRIQDTPPQSSLARMERMKSVQNAFAMDPLQTARVAGKRVVLVDDVMTTGASLHAAAHVLRRAGASHITGLVLARTE